MTRTRFRHAAPVAFLAALLAGGVARAGDGNDLRDLRVGMPAGALPPEGYAGFACADDPTLAIRGWPDWPRCPPDASGAHAVRFRYRDGETEVAGHPVRLQLLIAAPGRVTALRIETDPAAPPYLRKKAFLLGLQARARYGAAGWQCVEGAPDATAQPIGDTFIAEHCEKRLGDRRIVIARELFRRPDAPPHAFMNATRIDILANP